MPGQDILLSSGEPEEGAGVAGETEEGAGGAGELGVRGAGGGLPAGAGRVESSACGAGELLQPLVDITTREKTRIVLMKFILV